MCSMSPAPQISLCERDSVICVCQTWRVLSLMLHLFDDPDIVMERGDCVVGRPAQLASHCACESSVQMRPRNLSAHSLVFLGGLFLFFLFALFQRAGRRRRRCHSSLLLLEELWQQCHRREGGAEDLFTSLGYKRQKKLTQPYTVWKRQIFKLFL